MNVVCFVTVGFSEGAVADNIKQARQMEHYTPGSTRNRQKEER